MRPLMDVALGHGLGWSYGKSGPALRFTIFIIFMYAAPQFQLHTILWVAVSSTVGLRVEHRHHLQSICLQDVVLVDQTEEKSSCSVLQHPPYSPDLSPSDFHLTMTTFNTKSYCG
ncbi:hypothetical protein AVEN_171818-1 [Araneus ventricosus]|uniref:Tc1-like transposase DDE domain-containing protein n=1 Tax=Araneus ventricosus TaxID=182803 RepID=A0A4Y2SH56_ARAVE|nr:hypothetical protein AVEN_171818-1 [Araneus ventricosus]